MTLRTELLPLAPLPKLLAFRAGQGQGADDVEPAAAGDGAAGPGARATDGQVAVGDEGAGAEVDAAIDDGGAVDGERAAGDVEGEIQRRALPDCLVGDRADNRIDDEGVIRIVGADLEAHLRA